MGRSAECVRYARHPRRNESVGAEYIDQVLMLNDSGVAACLQEVGRQIVDADKESHEKLVWY